MGTGFVDGMGLAFAEREAEEDRATSWEKVRVGARAVGRAFEGRRRGLGFLA
jgi:hypothetical protein